MLFKYFARKRDRKYKEMVQNTISREILSFSSGIPYDILDTMQKNFSQLVKYKFIPQHFKKLQYIKKEKGDHHDFNKNHFYYGRESQTNPGQIIIYLRKYDRTTSVPKSFLLHEKEWFKSEFNKKMDKVLK